jgi:hypothetical protein
MPVRAGVLCVPFVAALVTPFEVSAERGSPAQFDGAQHTLLPHGQRLGMRLAKLVAMRAHNVCDFKCRPHQKTATYCWGSITG